MNKTHFSEIKELMKNKGRIIVALDGMDPQRASDMSEKLVRAECDEYWGGKGNDLLAEIEARRTVRILAADNFSYGAFTDPKLHDIPKSVANTARKLADAGADLITVHACDGIEMLAAAVKAVEGTQARILGVTVLTSMKQDQITRDYDAGVTIRDLVRRRAEWALEAGCWGIVSAAGDLEAVRDLPIKKVTPNIRLEDAKPDDQNRERQMTPEGAIDAGSDLLVIGRPITEAPDPVAALKMFAERLRRVA